MIYIIDTGILRAFQTHCPHQSQFYTRHFVRSHYSASWNDTITHLKHSSLILTTVKLSLENMVT